MSENSNSCVLCHHLKKDHVFDEKEDYEYCLKWDCNKYKEV